MIMHQAGSPMTGFRPFFNPATGEWIEYTAIAEDNHGQLVRFTWRSVPGGVITEHIHPRQEERFTIIELVAAFVLPVIVIAAGHSDWVLPSIVITIGPLLLWLDHLVHIPRYRVAGWALTAGPVILVVTMSGSALAVTTGIAAGVVLLGTAAAGFHDLAGIRPASPARLSSKAR